VIKASNRDYNKNSFVSSCFELNGLSSELFFISAADKYFFLYNTTKFLFVFSNLKVKA